MLGELGGKEFSQKTGSNFISYKPIIILILFKLNYAKSGQIIYMINSVIGHGITDTQPETEREIRNTLLLCIALVC
jgi:hypothetical protein